MVKVTGCYAPCPVMMFQPLLSSNFSCSLLFHRKTYLRNWCLTSERLFYEIVLSDSRSQPTCLNPVQQSSHLVSSPSSSLFGSIYLSLAREILFTTVYNQRCHLFYGRTFIVSHQSRASQVSSSIHSLLSLCVSCGLLVEVPPHDTQILEGLSETWWEMQITATDTKTVRKADFGIHDAARVAFVGYLERRLEVIFK